MLTSPSAAASPLLSSPLLPPWSLFSPLHCTSNPVRRYFPHTKQKNSRRCHSLADTGSLLCRRHPSAVKWAFKMSVSRVFVLVIVLLVLWWVLLCCSTLGAVVWLYLFCSKCEMQLVMVIRASKIDPFLIFYFNIACWWVLWLAMCIFFIWIGKYEHNLTSPLLSLYLIIIPLYRHVPAFLFLH